MGDALKHKLVFLFPPKPAIPSRGLVVEVDKFEEAKDIVLQKLKEGLIVRSKLHNEQKVEYLAPLWDADRNMIILGAQVKMCTHSVALQPLCIRVM